MAIKTVVYSVVVANYDMVFPPKTRTQNVRYLLFTDCVKEVNGWDIVDLDRRLPDTEPALINRWYKFFPHKVIGNADYSIYIDGNIRITADLDPIIREFKDSRAAIGLFKHSTRDNIVQEANACRRHGQLDFRDNELVEKQLRRYTAEGLPAARTLTENSIIFRWHRHPALEAAMQLWWTQLKEFTKRDQLSLPYVLWKNDVPFHRWEWSFQESNEFFQPYPHRRSFLRDTWIRCRIRKDDGLWWYLAYRGLHALKRALPDKNSGRPDGAKA